MPAPRHSRPSVMTLPSREKVLKFIDTATLPQRLNRTSISCEYISKTFGWSEVRYFAVDREEGQPLKRVLLTIQDINDEKRELDQLEERVAQTEYESMMRSALIAEVASKMKPPIEAILELDERILSESDKKTADRYAREIDIKGKTLSYMIDSAVDAALIAAGTIETKAEDYSLRTLVRELCETASTMAKAKRIEFTTSISSSAPDHLVGDAQRIERALIGLFSNVGNRMEGGSIKFSLFDKAVDDNAHLLFSVHANGYRLADDEMEYFMNFQSQLRENGNIAISASEPHELETIAKLLMFLKSELHVVNGPGEECELYFEIDQKVKG